MKKVLKTKKELSFAFVNLKPVLPGHVLISPKRVEPEYANLSEEEICDLMCAVKKVNKCVVDVFKGTSSTIIRRYEISSFLHKPLRF